MDPIETRDPAINQDAPFNNQKTPITQKSFLISTHRLSTLETCPGVKFS
jgi:hypothetical protein